MRHRLLAAAALTVLAACGDADRPMVENGAPAQPPVASDPVARNTAGLPPVAELPADLRAPEPAGEAPAADTDRTPPATPDGSRPSSPAASTPPSAAPPLPATPPAAQGTNANDILARAERAYGQLRSMEADFVQQVRVPLLESTQHSRGKIYHRSPDRFRMDFSDPAGDLIVVDGEYGYMYYPSNDPVTVMRSRLAAGGQQLDLQREFLSDATNRFDATLTGTENVGGRPAHALTLMPRGSSPYQRVRIWVDTQDSLVRRFEIVEQNESVRRIEMSNLRPNVTLSDNLFVFTPPPGTQIFEP
jgi:outer membrane lipoprotein carrier protein